MRKSKTSDGLKVNAVAGTYVVMLGINLPEDKCDELLGFSIHRYDHNENEAYYLKGMKAFSETDPGLPAGSQYSTKSHPIQSFQWADYSAKPGYTYTYTVEALKGTPVDLTVFATTKVRISTEEISQGTHVVYFNRGTSASQEYARRFGNVRPDKVPNNKAFEWLSRGAYEALESFVSSCVPGVHALRIAAYEFHYEPFLKLLKATANNGVDIHIVYDARKASPGEKNEKAVLNAGLDSNCTQRKEGKSYISHNKFIVKLENNQPVSVWTGGMNFSAGGIFGHSNVAHVLNSSVIADVFYAYWLSLKDDLKTVDIKHKVEELTPLPNLPLTKSETAVFSPRKNLDALKMYSHFALSAKRGLFMTFAFGINSIFKNVFKNSHAPLRFALLENATRPMKDGPEKKAEEQEIQKLRNKVENVFAIGNQIVTNKFDGWLQEKLSGLNMNVKYVHNKFMLIDPLSKKPVVITGSANFSDASTINNDENMVVISGNTRVADIYLGEYMRLFSHHSFRESLTWNKSGLPPKPLRTDNWWMDYFGNTSRSLRRKFFAQVR